MALEKFARQNHFESRKKKTKEKKLSNEADRETTSTIEGEHKTTRHCENA